MGLSAARNVVDPANSSVLDLEDRIQAREDRLLRNLALKGPGAQQITAGGLFPPPAA